MKIRYNEIASLAVCTMLLALWLIPSASTIATDMGNRSQTIQSLSSMPLAFTANYGQWDDKVKFQANAGGVTMWFGPDGAYYQFTREIESVEGDSISIVDKRYGNIPDDNLGGEPKSVEAMMIRANFIGANANPTLVGVDLMEYKCNYFIGNDPNEWHTDVPNFSAVLYEQIYDGIDLKYYGNGKQMEYDFIVSPGADFTQIRIQYEGAESISVNAFGELVIETAWGDLIEQRPMIYQVENNNRIPVDGEYLIQGDDSFGFELSSYNPELPLLIDPVISYSTYLGGNSHDYGRGIAVDASGAAYVTGYTSSNDFPILDPYQGIPQGGSQDVFVTKFTVSGNSLVYSTFLGGSSSEEGLDIAVDASKSAYVTGYTKSTDFPTLDPYQGTNHGGAFGDVFVTKLSSFGNSLVYSTYLGGSHNDIAEGIALDASGSAYVTGYTYSTDFPMLNPYQGSLQGTTDVFVTKFSSSGTSLDYSTYLGGSSTDFGLDIAVDTSGSAYVTGYTNSLDFPTINPYQEGSGFDVIVTKLSSSGNNLIYSTYLGGYSIDYGWAIVIDASGAAYVTGNTSSSNFPMLNPYQGTSPSWPLDNVFVTKFMATCCDLAGDFNDDGDINVADLTYTVDFMFKGGSAPPCTDEADLNADCDINISDLTYRVAFMFQGGPAPVCGCAAP